MTRAPEVLLVAFHYPPEVSGGIPRALAFEEQLVRRGCRVRVLTPQPATGAARGGELMSVPLPGLVRPAAGSDVASPVARRSLLRNVARRWVFVPDGFVLWTRRAVRVALQSAGQRPVDLVITSSPPESMHGIGRRLKHKLGCRWLADLRDGWTFEPHREEALLPVRSAVERRMEKRVVRRADWVTAATSPLAEDLQVRYPERRNDIHLLPTGFTPWPGCGDVAPAGEAKDFVLIYTGRMGLSRNSETPRVFFAALGRLLRGDDAFARQFRLRLMGHYTDEECALWAGDEFRGRVEIVEPQPYEVALRESAAATMTLLFTPDGQRSIATRKVFDYLAVRRPVFALAQGNEAARILDVSRAGLCVPAHDVGAAMAGLRDAMRMWRDGVLDREIPCDNVQAFAADRLFAPLLDEHVLPALRSSLRGASGPLS